MNFYEPGNHLVELKAEWDNYRFNRYPKFVTHNTIGNGPVGVPVFSFHDVEQEPFEEKLDYLKTNGYETVTADEHLDLADKETRDRVVMLTFDDGLASLWKVAYPALKKYGMKAVAFVLPGDTNDAGAPRGPFADDGDDDALCTWPELAAMRDVIDIQSHNLRHWVMFVSGRVECFYTPAMDKVWSRINLPVVNNDGEDGFGKSFPVGTPFYEMDSRLSDMRRVFEPASVRNRLGQFVADHGGDDFFKDKSWKARLMAEHANAAAGLDFRRETGGEREESILKMMAESKRILEQRLPGHSVKHLCFPFGIGGKTAVRMVEQAGYSAMYWGVSTPSYARDCATLRSVTRIKDDYIFRLPGRGRWSLGKIFSLKIRRRSGFDR